MEDINQINRENYLLQLKQQNELKLLIVGQDPYPVGANGIAFCKNTFDEMFHTFCSGKEVLFSLGYSEEALREKYTNPIELFTALLQQGVAFINVSSVLLDDATSETLESDLKYNTHFIQKAQNIVVLGKSTATQLFNHHYPSFGISESLIHPSGRNKTFNLLEWERVWKIPYLKTRFMTKFGENELTMDLTNYFNFDVSPAALIAKGAVIFGQHGIEEIDGEFYASHFHLKTKIAKGKIKEFLDTISSQELFSLASKENTDFSSWPEVEYELLPRTKKYKFSWLVQHVIYANTKYAEELDFCRSQISPKAAEILDSLINDKSSLKTSKFNSARIMLEEIGKSLIEKELAPRALLDEKTFNNIAMSLFLKGKDPFKMGVTLNKENTFPNFITYGMDFIHQCGNSGSHSNKGFDEYLASNESQYLRNAVVYTTLGIVKYLKLYFESNPKKNNWVTTKNN